MNATMRTPAGLTGVSLGRRGFLGAALVGPLLARVAPALTADTSNPTPLVRKPASRLLVIWLDGGPSQLETFDPKPGTAIGGPTEAIPTKLPGCSFAAGLSALAARADRLTVVRSLVSKEGDHERGRYHVKTGHRQGQAVAHPSLGALAASALPRRGTLPPFVSVLGEDRQDRGGLLGAALDPFAVEDPGGPIPDLAPAVPTDRFARRQRRLGHLETLARRGRADLAAKLPPSAVRDAALDLMTRPEKEAFDLSKEPAAVRDDYGDTLFGRGCLLARRLLAAGVVCAEVTLGGWDTHVKNFAGHAALTAVLDRGLSALLDDLDRTGLSGETLLVCVGEFGRTPSINVLGGRDHWPTGFSAVLAGGPVARGRLIGATDDAGRPEVKDPVSVPDFTATVLAGLGIDPAHENTGPLGRPIRRSDGAPVAAVFG